MTTTDRQPVAVTRFDLGALREGNRAGARVRASQMLGRLALAALLIGACSADRGTTSESEPQTGRSAATSFWTPLRISGDWVEGYPTLTELATNADAVVAGTLGPFSISEVVQGDALEDQVVYVATDILVSEVLLGDAKAESMTVQFLLPVMPDAAESTVKQMNASLPPDPVVLFARHHQTDDGRTVTTVVNGYGLWAATDRAALDAPLQFEPPAVEGVYRNEIGRIDSMEEFIDFLRQVG